MSVALDVTTTDPGDVWPAYDAVFGDQPDESTWRERVWDAHVARRGFRLATAREHGRVVGFGYGYTGEHGQWWTDRVARTLDSAVAHEWLGAHFELVSIGVVAPARGHGLGRALMRALTAGLFHDRQVLQATADPDDPARRLYAAEGWSVLGPGVRPDTVVLGRARA